MIEKVKQKMILLKNKQITFRYNGSRNQIEEFSGMINNCYKSIFTINVDGLVRSFAYSDVLIGSLEVDI